jgi:multidrug resistance efflux pump
MMVTIVRTVKSAVGIGLVLWGAWRGYIVAFVRTSTGATVCGRVYTLQAPIEGFLKSAHQRPGEIVEAGTSVAELDNPMVDTSAVAGLESRIAAIDGEVASLEAGLQDLKGVNSKLRRGAHTYQENRLAQLSTQLAEDVAKLEAVKAREDLTSKKLVRMQALSTNGLISTEAVEEAERDKIVAAKETEAFVQSIATLRVSIESAKAGTNVDVSAVGPDKPYSVQRSDELDVTLVQRREELEARRAQRTALEAELHAQVDRVARLSHAVLTSPDRARVLRAAGRPGEYMVRGQAVLDFLSCNDVFVVATVDESTFNKLRVGTSAAFELKYPTRRFGGTVIQLLGRVDATVSSFVSSTGLGPTILTPTQRDPFVVILEIPDLRAAAAGSCELGKTGEVIFDP